MRRFVSLTNIVKDEFETQTEYDKRKLEAAAKADAVMAEYGRRIFGREASI